MEAKIRNTPARSAITAIFESADSPIDVEQIIGFLRSKKLKTNKVTVYRILDFLYKNGIVDKLEFGEGKFRYEVKKEDHHHLVCNNCNALHKVIDLCKSEIIKGKDDFKGALSISDIKFSLPSNIVNILETYHADLASWEYAKFIIDNQKWGSYVVLTTDEADDLVQGKMLVFISASTINIESFSRSNVFEDRT